MAKVSPCLTIIIQPTNQPEPAPTCFTIMIQPTNTFSPTLAITIPPTDQDSSHLGQHQQSRIPSHFLPLQPRHDQAYYFRVALAMGTQCTESTVEFNLGALQGHQYTAQWTCKAIKLQLNGFARPLSYILMALQSHQVTAGGPFKTIELHLGSLGRPSSYISTALQGHRVTSQLPCKAIELHLNCLARPSSYISTALQGPRPLSYILTALQGH
ncbi:hypothetical protein PCANC_15424 [Puccinia coronata f. sp. avenae]|uniref:Uncharacterized protein n=1 Tax=Puccinia coronata f. sp. avenae TaxID=200324 RepID=A0A2N5SWK9_9BASI|nr:hypothetical protein PCANC_15424 [Puccinia coronata f. sp. avenae]